MSLLEVKDLKTYFHTRRGIIKAVNGVSYSVDAGRTLGIVGESGSGKSVSAMSILNLVDSNGWIEGGEILFDGTDMTTALDVTIQAQILRLMNNLKKEKGTAILFITHDLGVINQMADDVAVMYCGQVVEMSPARTIFDQSISPFLHPYTEGLLRSIPRLDTEVHTRLEVIPGSVPHPAELPVGCKFAPRCKYATEKCRTEEPQLVQVSETQQVRCFYPRKEERK